MVVCTMAAGALHVTTAEGISKGRIEINYIHCNVVEVGI